MQVSENGLELIKAFEGCILESYDDYNDKVVPAGGSCRGTLTIGIGHTSAAGAPKVTKGMKITEEEAMTILQDDLAKVEASVAKLLPNLNQDQNDAMVSFDYNTGALASSSILTHLRKGDVKGAMDVLLEYDHASGRVLSGLVRRRKAERLLFMGEVAAALKLANQ